ncbi:4Fe-4S binding protein [Pseudoramibacter sp. HA2172]|uniref:4Fe-4S binding protein n=1 Tax=Pseudoramibacter faecis TaxID=3108534 RepID=UPI002E7A7B0C|nr:4Fe-4S binding protein [Pseudoramibacter sp. HA2172]
MAKAKADTDLCKGCRLCVGVCPVKAIEPLIEVNKKGYEIIRIDEKVCIGCGQCYVMCPDYVFTVE